MAFLHNIQENVSIVCKIKFQLHVDRIYLKIFTFVFLSKPLILQNVTWKMTLHTCWLFEGLVFSKWRMLNHTSLFKITTYQILQQQDVEFGYWNFNHLCGNCYKHLHTSKTHSFTRFALYKGLSKYHNNCCSVSVVGEKTLLTASQEPLHPNKRIPNVVQRYPDEHHICNSRFKFFYYTHQITKMF